MAAAAMKPTVEVVMFRPELASAFAELNLAWIRRFFEVEEMDLQQVSDPAASIIAPGGEIFFVMEDNRPVGTCAMVAEGPHHYELAKMAVDPSCQGRGYANLLMESAIAWARAQGAHAITLLSNTKLVPAIKLYEKYGFVTVHLGPHAHYKRTDIEMRLPL